MRPSLAPAHDGGAANDASYRSRGKSHHVRRDGSERCACRRRRQRNHEIEELLLTGAVSFPIPLDRTPTSTAIPDRHEDQRRGLYARCAHRVAIRRDPDDECRRHIHLRPQRRVRSQAFTSSRRRPPPSMYRVVDDGAGGFDTATVTIVVTGVNHAPRGAAGRQRRRGQQTLSGQCHRRNGYRRHGGRRGHGYDFDPLFVVLSPAAQLGCSFRDPWTALPATLNANGGYTFVPTMLLPMRSIEGQVVTQQVTYTISDGQGGGAGDADTHHHGPERCALHCARHSADNIDGRKQRVDP